MKLPYTALLAACITCFAPAVLADGPPDIVRTKDGGMLRGTIEELIPGKKVVILLGNGERRTIEGEVEYAGPAAKDPKAPPKEDPPPPPKNPKNDPAGPRPFATVHGEPAEVSFVSDQPGTTVHVKTGEAKRGTLSASGFTLLCTAPCTVTLPAGSYVFGASRGDSKIGAASAVQVPAGRSELFVRFDDASGTRVAGYVVWFGGIAVGLGLAAADSKNASSAYAGIGIAGVSALVGWIMTSTDDSAAVRGRAAIRVAPAVAQGERRDGSKPLLPGLAVGGRF